MEGICLRAAAPADAEAIAAILRSVGTFGALPDAARMAAAIADLAATAEHRVVVADLAGQGAVGYLSMHRLPCLFLTGPEGFVSELFVHRDFSGRGIGGLLLDDARRFAEAAGWSRLHLINNRERESYRRGFYAARGWTERPAVADFVSPLPGGPGAAG